MGQDREATAAAAAEGMPGSSSAGDPDEPLGGGVVGASGSGVASELSSGSKGLLLCRQLLLLSTQCGLGHGVSVSGCRVLAGRVCDSLVLAIL